MTVSRLETTFLGETTARYSLLAAILLAAFALGLYRIDSPLWLDEIYGYRLAKLGPRAILENSWTDPHPPLYYLMQWLTSGFGQVKTEIGWRWLPLLSGTLFVAVIWLTVKDIAGFAAGILVGLVAATSPSLVFYSQEARPIASLALVASLSMWLTITMVRDDSRSRLWISWAVLSLVGLYMGYAYALVAGVQLLFLGFCYHRRIAWMAAAILIVGGSLFLFPFAASSLGRVGAFHTNTEPLTFWRTLQTVLAGEPIRYGFSRSHNIVPVLAVGLFVVTLVRTIRQRDKRLGYLVLQVALPMGVFFTFSPLLGIRLPLPEAKQFMILLPAILVLMASGLVELCGWFARSRQIALLMVAIVCGAMVFLNAIGLYSYWSNSKSPEGLAVLRLRDRLRPDESVVSLHYATTYAFGFYTSGTPIFMNPEPDNGTYRYRLTDSEHVFSLHSTLVSEKETEDIRAGGRFWILAHSAAYREPLESLVAGCRVVEQQTFSARNAAFELMKVECPVRPLMLPVTWQ